MQDIIKSLLQIEEEASQRIAAASKEAERLKAKVARDMDELRVTMLEKSKVEVEALRADATRRAGEQIEKIRKSAEWSMANMEEKFGKKRDACVAIALGMVKPKI